METSPAPSEEQAAPTEAGGNSPSTPQSSRDSAWAPPVHRLKTTGLPTEAVNLNVDGRVLTGPLQGFGQLWQKTYRVRLTGVEVTPEEVIKVWKQNFASFWPKGNRFYGSMTGINPGDVAVLNLAGPGGITGPRGMPLISTGILVIYADDQSFSFMTPEGHMFSAMITFSAEKEDVTMAQIRALIRASDPIYETGLRMGLIHKTEDEFWRNTLRALASRLGVSNPEVQQQAEILDPKVQWSYARKIWQNAAVRTGIYVIMSPVRWVRDMIRR